MLNNIIVRLVIYYAAWLLALSGIFHLFPQILYYVALERERIFVSKGLVPGTDAVPFPLGDIQSGVGPAHRPGPHHSGRDRHGAGFRSYPPDYLGILLDEAAQEIQSGICTDPARGARLHCPGCFSRKRQSCPRLQPGRHRRRGPLPDLAGRADRCRVHVHGHRHRAGRRHPAHHGGLSRIPDVRCNLPRCVEDQLRRAAGSAVGMENRPSPKGGAGLRSRQQGSCRDTR